MNQNINEIRKELIRETLWIHYNKENIGNKEFESMIENLSSDLDLKEQLRSIILCYANEYKK